MQHNVDDDILTKQVFLHGPHVEGRGLETGLITVGANRKWV
jgi:hypothetical protein